MGWGKRNETPGEKLQRERDARRHEEDRKSRQRAAKTEDKEAPPHYTQASKKGGHTRRAERHHGED